MRKHTEYVKKLIRPSYVRPLHLHRPASRRASATRSSLRPPSRRSERMCSPSATAGISRERRSFSRSRRRARRGCGRSGPCKCRTRLSSISSGRREVPARVVWADSRPVSDSLPFFGRRVRGCVCTGFGWHAFSVVIVHHLYIRPTLALNAWKHVHTERPPLFISRPMSPHFGCLLDERPGRGPPALPQRIANDKAQECPSRRRQAASGPGRCCSR